MSASTTKAKVWKAMVYNFFILACARHFIIGTALVCVLLGVWALKYDYKRLTKVYTQGQG